MSHRRWTERGAVLACATTVLLLLAACGQPKTVVTFFTVKTDDATESYWQGVIKDFEAQNPTVHVDLHLYTGDEGASQIDALIQRGHPPELARIPSNALPQYVSEGLIQPLDSYLTPDYRAFFIPSLINRGAQYQDRTFGLPLNVTVQALYYNKTLLQQAGIAAPPATWDDLRSDALKISPLSNNVWGFGLLGSGTGTDLGFYDFLWGEGGQPLTPDGIRASFDSEPGVTALTYLRGLVADGATEPDPSQATQSSLEASFLNGQYGMIVSTTKLAQTLTDQHPFPWGVAALPYDTTPAHVGIVDDLVMFQQADNKDLAWQFIQFLYQPKYRVELDVKEGALPATIPSAAAPEIVNNPTTPFFLSQLQDASFRPVSIKSTDISNVVAQAVLGAYTGQQSPEEALKAAAASVNELLSYSATAW